jgi:MFS-type transporter involved in bile tolerance (Atg22 family)
MFGMLSAFGNFGCVVMPWIVGIATDWSNMRWGLSIATLCPLIMIFLLLRLQAMTAAE